MNLSQADRFAQMALDMMEQPDLASTLDRILLNARNSIPCDAAGVLVVAEGGRLETAAASDDVGRRADELQCQGESPWNGPGPRGGTREQSLLISDTQRDDRYPTWVPQVAELGFAAVLSLRLYTPLRTVGALNLYACARCAFTGADIELAEIFARHASMALTSAQYGDSLRAAVNSRHLIGQAQGILMERYQVDADRAFEVLRRYSQHRNVKLRLIAEQVIADHRLPD